MSIQLYLWYYWALYHLFFIVRDDIRSWCLISVPPWFNFMAIILPCSWWILSEKLTIQWIDVNATFYSVTFQSDMRNSKVTAWKSCQTQYLTTICNLKRHFKLRALICGCYHFQKILIWMVWLKCWVYFEAYCSHSNIQFLVTERSQNSTR
mgnify:CR=1 FL=1